MGELSALLPADRMVAAFRRIVTDPVDGSMLDADGGETRVDNTDPLCRHHHRLKHAGTWTLSQPVPGHHIWTSQIGYQYITEPGPYLDEQV
ncbi:hypothetical protein [Candidatus Frankia alpina]|uniref:hypothetical protein n=1 Tax=Candidatus Frankia alpina TaxID=2699483 RepID=UPI0013D47D2D|nr:hypothetical protein [Candidatus Frankia alpina]